MAISKAYGTIVYKDGSQKSVVDMQYMKDNPGVIIKSPGNTQIISAEKKVDKLKIKGGAGR